MTIENVKQGLSQGGTKGTPEKTPAPSPKESAFGEKGYITHDAAKARLTGDKNRIFQRYGVRGSDVDRLAKEITDQRFGPLTDANDLKKYKDDRKKEIDKIPSLNERKKAEQDLEEKMKILRDSFPEGE